MNYGPFCSGGFSYLLKQRFTAFGTFNNTIIQIIMLVLNLYQIVIFCSQKLQCNVRGRYFKTKKNCFRTMLFPAAVCE